jgi:entericidin B
MRRQIAAAVVVVVACMWTLSGCHTMKGLGKDVQRGGEAIEEGSGK